MAQINAALKATLLNYLSEASQMHNIDTAILFGSRATGASNDSSDIDLAIFSRDATELNSFKIMVDLLKLVARYKLDIQPLVFSVADLNDATNEFIVDEILAKGVIIWK